MMIDQKLFQIIAFGCVFAVSLLTASAAGAQCSSVSIGEWMNTAPPSEGNWSTQLITGPEICSDIHALVDGTSAIHIYAMDNNGHLLEFFRSRIGSGWQRVDITAATGTSISSIPNNLLLAGTAADIRVFALSGGDLVEFVTAGNTHVYQVFDLSAQTGGSTTLTGTPAPIQFGSSIHVYVSSQDGEMHDFVQADGIPWVDVNLTSIYGLTGVNPNPFAYGGNSIQIAAMAGSEANSGAHLVLFIESVGSDGSISGFPWSGDLSQLGGGPGNEFSVPVPFLVGPQGNDVTIWSIDFFGELVEAFKAPTANWTFMTSVNPGTGGGNITALYFSQVGPPDGTVKIFTNTVSFHLYELSGDPLTGVLGAFDISAATGIAIVGNPVALLNQGTMEVFALR